MGRNHPVGILLAALLFGALYQGGAELAFDMPKITREMVVVIQGLVILFAGALENMFRPQIEGFFLKTGGSPFGGGRVARTMMEFFTLFILVLDATFRVATPLVLAALAGMFSERSGVVDIGLEGKMLGGAFAAATVAAVAGSAWLGLGAGILASMCLAMLHGFACITHRGDQIISGVAINILVAGLAPTLGIAWFARGGQTPTLEGDQRFTAITWPMSRMAVADVPILGQIYSELISGHNILVYFAAAAVPVTAFILYRTRFGLRVRAVGENPAAVDTAGISVDLDALSRADGHRVPVRRRRHLSLGGPQRILRTRHDGGQGLPGAGSADLREMAAGAGIADLPAVRLPGGP